MSFEKQLETAFQQMEIEVSEEKLSLLSRYHQMLMESNKVLNLTAIDDDEQAIYRHYLDSASPLKHHLIPEGASLIDVGTGAGLPGIPLAILRDDIQVLLLDSLQKRVHFLNQVTEQLQLKNVTALHERAENAAHLPKYRQQYDIAVARAVSNLSSLIEYCLPYVKVGGKFIAFKGPDVKKEIAAASNALGQLGGGNVEIVEADVPTREHTLVVIEKRKDSPSQFPRKAGIPTKNPL